MQEVKAISADELYPETDVCRVSAATDEYRKHFESDGSALRFFSAPGRTEICGNHTDHNNGRVLAASVNCDMIAAVEPIDVGKAVIKYENEPEIGIWYEELSENDGEDEKDIRLVTKGILRGFCGKGLKIGGFKAYVVSGINTACLAGEAAFETLICTVISSLFNDGKVKPAVIAQITEKASGNRKKREGGYMDRLVCSHGGFVAIDFKDPASPIVERVPVDFSKFGHSLCIVDTGMGVVDLAPEYSSISDEMRKVAGFFDVKRLRQIVKQDITLNINALRDEFGDRAILRSLHFFDENARVDKLAHALRTGEFAHFLEYIKESGNSSYKYLQNVYTSFDSEHESVSIGLYFCESILKGKGACRIHGEGFSGAIQAFVPNETVKTFKVSTERIFGANSCHVLGIRQCGGVEIIPCD